MTRKGGRGGGGGPRNPELSAIGETDWPLDEYTYISNVAIGCSCWDCLTPLLAVTSTRYLLFSAHHITYLSTLDTSLGLSTTTPANAFLVLAGFCFYFLFSILSTATRPPCNAAACSATPLSVLIRVVRIRYYPYIFEQTRPPPPDPRLCEPCHLLGAWDEVRGTESESYRTRLLRIST